MARLCGFAAGKVGEKKKKIAELIEQLDSFITTIPVVGFNSQNYDLNVLKPHMVSALSTHHDDKISFVVKRTNDMTCIGTKRFQILDICNFIAPGFSYSKYLKAYGCEKAKGFFPYEWFDSLKKLDHTLLPPKSAFYSKLKRCSISDEEYAYCQSVW